MHVSSGAYKRLNGSLKCSVIKAGSVFKQVMVGDVLCTPEVWRLPECTCPQHTDQFLAFRVPCYNSCLPLEFGTMPCMSRTLFNTFCYHSCNKGMCCFSRIMSTHLMPMLSPLFSSSSSIKPVPHWTSIGYDGLAHLHLWIYCIDARGM